MQSFAEKIKDAATISEILSFYGLGVSRQRRIPCPIHGGTKRNFCYTDKVYHCWTCGAKGDAITLVREIFGISFSQALVKINSDFKLGIPIKPPTTRERILIREQRKIDDAFQILQQERDREYAKMCNLHRILWHQICTGDNRDDLRNLQKDVEDWLEENVNGGCVPWI